jgi:hypothetical protein
MAAILSVTYTPNYPGNHRICFRTTQPSYCCYNDDSTSVVGVSKTVEIDLDDFELCLQDLPVEIGCTGSIVDGYVQPICVEQGANLNRIAFTATFPSESCDAYNIECQESGIDEITINNPGYGWPVGVVPTVTVIDSSSQGIDFAGELTMNCLPGDNFCSIADINITNAGENYYNLNDLTVEVSPLPSCVSNVELLINGSFVNGFDGWTVSPIGLVPEAWQVFTQTANYNMELYSVTQPGTISQNILTPGKIYDISFKVGIGSVNGNSYFIVTAGTFDPSGTEPNQYLHTQPAGVAFLDNISFTLPCIGTSEFSIYVYSDVVEGPGAFIDIDNISVTETCIAINPDLQVTALTNCGTFTVPNCDGTANPTTYELSGGPQYAINVCSGGSGPEGLKYTITPNPVDVSCCDCVKYDVTNTALTDSFEYNYVDCLDQTIKTATIQAQETQQVCAVVSSIWPVDLTNNQNFEYVASGIQDC